MRSMGYGGVALFVLLAAGSAMADFSAGDPVPRGAVVSDAQHLLSNYVQYSAFELGLGNANGGLDLQTTIENVSGSGSGAGSGSGSGLGGGSGVGEDPPNIGPGNDGNGGATNGGSGIVDPGGAGGIPPNPVPAPGALLLGFIGLGAVSWIRHRL